MSKVWTLATTTLREMLREKIFFVVIVIAAIMIAMSFLLGALSFAEQQKILADFGFLAVQIALLGISLFSGAYLIAKEVEKQTCLLILSRPVTRNQFILGKVFGVVALNTLLITLLGVILSFLLGVWSQPSQWLAFFEICLSLWFESTVILAFTMWFSLVVRPVLALSAGIVLFLLGHWLGDMAFFASKSQEQMFIAIVKGLHWIVPNFYRMNWKSAYFLQEGLASNEVLWMVAHMVGWFIIYVLLTNFSFRRKDIV